MNKLKHSKQCISVSAFPFFQVKLALRFTRTEAVCDACTPWKTTRPPGRVTVWRQGDHTQACFGSMRWETHACRRTLGCQGLGDMRHVVQRWLIKVKVSSHSSVVQLILCDQCYKIKCPLVLLTPKVMTKLRSRTKGKKRPQMGIETNICMIFINKQMPIPF